ncbi:MAG: hypothetical protein ACE15C_15825 [Phycisphaerae bacterium]
MEPNLFELEPLEDRTLLSASVVFLPLPKLTLPKVATVVPVKPGASSLLSILQAIRATPGKPGIMPPQVRAALSNLSKVSAIPQSSLKAIAPYIKSILSNPSGWRAGLTNLINAIKANPHCPFNPLVRLLFP